MNRVYQPRPLVVLVSTRDKRAFLSMQGPWGDEEEWGRTFWGLREPRRGAGGGLWGRLDYILASPNLLVPQPAPPECQTVFLPTIWG